MPGYVLLYGNETSRNNSDSPPKMVAIEIDPCSVWRPEVMSRGNALPVLLGRG